MNLIDLVNTSDCHPLAWSVQNQLLIALLCMCVFFEHENICSHCFPSTSHNRSSHTACEEAWPCRSELRGCCSDRQWRAQGLTTPPEIFLQRLTAAVCGAAVQGDSDVVLMVTNGDCRCVPLPSAGSASSYLLSLLHLYFLCREILVSTKAVSSFSKLKIAKKKKKKAAQNSPWLSEEKSICDGVHRTGCNVLGNKLQPGSLVPCQCDWDIIQNLEKE